MESTLHKIKNLYFDMGPAEKRIADNILENSQELAELTVNELAERCRCGSATVVRFARRLGFSGYQSLKYGLAREMQSVSKLDRQILKSDSCFEIFRKQSAEISFALQSTLTVLEESRLNTAAEKIMNAERIAVFGLGNSASIALDAAHKFMRLGLDAQACSDNHMQAIVASHLNRSCVAVGISHSGASKDIIEALELSKIGSASTICITNHADSPIVKVSDIPLFTSADETKHSILALSSRYAQLAIIDAIYSYIVVRSDKAALQAIYNTEYSLKKKKVAFI